MKVVISCHFKQLSNSSDRVGPNGESLAGMTGTGAGEYQAAMSPSMTSYAVKHRRDVCKTLIAFYG